MKPLRRQTKIPDKYRPKIIKKPLTDIQKIYPDTDIEIEKKPLKVPKKVL